MGSHVTPDKFDKEYAYAVRYLYGKEGNGHGFRPFSCVRMIMGEPPNERDGKIHGDTSPFFRLLRRCFMSN